MTDLQVYYEIEGGRPLKGEIAISGAKNAATKLIIASLLSNDICVISNVPRIRDVEQTLNICEALGCSYRWTDASTVEIDSTGLSEYRIPLRYSGAMRSSVLFVAPMLKRLGKADLQTIGGCNLGLRPIDFHIAGLKRLNASVTEEDHTFHFTAERLIGSIVELDYPSVGATEQLIIAAVGAEGRTVIRNAAIEPEIQNLVGFLQSMGAIIYQDEYRTWIIDGVENFHGCSYWVINDRIEAASFACLAVATRGDIFVRGAEQEHMITFLNMFRKAGGVFEVDRSGIRFNYEDELKPVILETDVHPGFMTDWQPPFVTMLTQAQGISIVHETVYENRFGYVQALLKMDAKIQLHKSCLGRKKCRFRDQHFDHSAIVQGITALKACDIEIPDLRAGFAYLMASFIAEGTSRISGIEYVKRGYSFIQEKLAGVGGSILEISQTPDTVNA
ncbi:MAG: UDP-N-acetylglucosamine 1-carboxyvinyltransferase [Spirochaetales bacterium]|nr:UDP-N-acetylglucosamine 1-carboxyvinyltransferase [Spirochaetales bacterium]